MQRLALSPAAPAAVAARTIVGAAPVLQFPVTTPKLPRDQQVAKNTKIATNLVKRFKGPLPPAYTRKHTATIDQIEKEVDTLLGSAEKLRKPVGDEAPMDKLTLMERCLQHGIWSYKKDEGQHNFDEYAKWLVYTPTDESRLNLLKREVDLKKKYAAFKERRAAEGGAALSLPKVDWAAEYASAVDREVVAEKRFRYYTLAANTRDRDEGVIEELNKSYRRSVQDKRLDDLVELLERFKPVLAREAILQRLAIKHLEGQLGIWRYLDWCPEVRDRAELEIDNHAVQWWSTWEEKRLSQIRLRSKSEVVSVMEKNQADAAQAQAQKSGASQPTATKGGDDARDKLLKEVLALQARVNSRSDDEAPADDKKASAKH